MIQGILKYAPDNTVFMWVPGHCGVRGNERADRLAGTGYSGRRYTKRIPLIDLKRWIKGTFRQYWEDSWFSTRTPFLRQIKNCTTTWTDAPILRDQRVLSRLRTGHTLISHNMGNGPFHIECEICHIPASVDHILCVCPSYHYQRQTHNLADNIGEILQDDPASIATLLSFLHDAGLYNRI